ncbi:SpaH/EbpB family LPXTG-anchored major pilin [Corynebacterium liangguodongii]|uniref:Uncharacterized protein n=1 Tax=Corynebacterium liangguodongii TaxID=2079535 RepID=A0A2S0WH87_9CORY|nr:SpaH/EbpB family LPXTG-anchored major pilin [Corynebacterium liangguodongii]AWB85147.1 hypothetical protein C3E79_09495 [Corynebacterium liangguodongii]PWB99772.1 isopeptide-forming domain-containing fimbrial protein [Corynebacterium liangguodongii]
MSRISSKALAIAAAATIAAASPLAFSPNAPFAVAQNTQGVDINADASLTIDKRLGEAGGTTTPLQGTSFKVERVAMTNQLNTAAGWQEASDITAAGAAAANVTGEAFTVATGADGKAVFPDVTVGLYRVTEIQNGNYTVAAPFLVTLPLIEDGVVNYNPTISPKNQLLEPTKSAVDTNVTVGQDIVYTVNAPVPAGDVLQDDTRTITQFRIEDTLQQGLTYNQTEGAQVTVTGGAGGETLEAGTDYTVDWTAPKLTVDFTDAGRAKLAEWRATNPGLTVSVKFNATVTQIPANGQFSNTAQVFIPNATTPLDTTPSTPNDGTDDAVTTQYSDVAVSKTVNGVNVDEGTTGAGAVFEIYECTAQGSSYQIAENAAPLTGANAEGTATAGTTITTAGGSADAAAVANGYALQFDPEKQYCAVETQAPAGYLLKPDPTPLNLTTPGDADSRPIYTATVNNVKDNIFGKLPATGTTTMLAMLAIGLVLFAGGAAYQLRRNNA